MGYIEEVRGEMCREVRDHWSTMLLHVISSLGSHIDVSGHCGPMVELDFSFAGNSS